MVGYSVYGVDLVVAVEIGIEAVHQHHHFVGFGPSLRRIHDERTVQTFVDVALQGEGVAMIEVEPHRRCVELVYDVSPGLTTSKTPSIAAAWIPWKWIVWG